MKFTDPVGAQLNLSEMLQILGNGYYFDPLIYTCMHSFKVFNVITFIAFEGTEKHLKISPKLQIQNLDQTLCSKSEQKFSFLTKPQLQNLQQFVANTILISYAPTLLWLLLQMSQSLTPHQGRKH